MKKLSTRAAHAIEKLQTHRLTIGLDLGDCSSYYCVLDEGGRIVLEGKVATTPKGLEARFAAIIKNPYLYS
jgi:transposase